MGKKAGTGSWGIEFKTRSGKPDNKVIFKQKNKNKVRADSHTEDLEKASHIQAEANAGAKAGTCPACSQTKHYAAGELPRRE